MKSLFKFVVVALGIAVIAFSLIAIINRLRTDSYCPHCDDSEDDEFGDSMPF